MSEWKETTLDKVADIDTGFAFKSKNYSDSGLLRVVRGKNVTVGKMRWGQDAKFWDYSTKKLKRYLLDENDIVIGMDGSKIGENRSKIKKVDLPAILAQRVARVKANEGNSQDFIWQSIRGENFVQYIKSIHTGTSIPHISQKQIGNFEIYLPPLFEQRAIASVLSSLDDKIDLLHRQNQTLEQMAEALFRQWFVEEADEDWEDQPFGDFVKPKKGKNLTKSQAIDGLYPVVAGGLEPMCSHNESNTNSPVVTISASGANAGFVRLYTTEIWSSDSSYIDNTISPYVYFCYLFLRSKQEILFDKQTGSAQPHIYPTQIMELDFLNYPNKLVGKFEDWCTPLFEKIKSNQTQIQNLTNLRDTLLPKLMSGEVRVSID